MNEAKQEPVAVPNEVVSKAIMDAPDTRDIPRFIAQRAAEWACQQKHDRAVAKCDKSCYANPWGPCNCNPAPEAKQEPRLWQDGDDLTIAYLAGYGKAKERIAELEAQNAQMLGALRYFMSAVENSSHLDARRGIMAGAFDIAHAAIAAAEGETK